MTALRFLIEAFVRPFCLRLRARPICLRLRTRGGPVLSYSDIFHQRIFGVSLDHWIDFCYTYYRDSEEMRELCSVTAAPPRADVGVSVFCPRAMCLIAHHAYTHGEGLKIVSVAVYWLVRHSTTLGAHTVRGWFFVGVALHRRGGSAVDLEVAFYTPIRTPIYTPIFTPYPQTQNNTQRERFLGKPYGTRD